MPRIDEDDLCRVREATDLVQIVSERVTLKQKGRLFWGCCPFHNEKTPSFKVDPAMQLWHCFGCGKGGDAFGFVMELEKLNFVEAVQLLADRAHIELKQSGGKGVSRGEKQRIFDANAKAQAFYNNELLRSQEKGAAQSRQYLSERGFGSVPSKKWALGFAPGSGALCSFLRKEGFTRDELIKANLASEGKNGRLRDRFFNRIMFPVHDMQGNTVAFGGRVIGSGEPKYLNTSETPVFHKSSNMFGIDKAKSALVRCGTAIVVEGYTDVIAMHEAGLENTVATLGTALTSQHVKLLSRFAKKIVYLFDGDAAGQKAAMRASEFIDWTSALESQHNPIELDVAILPDNLDPADFLSQRGASAMQKEIETAQPLLRFCINRCLDAFDLSKPELKVRALNDALKILSPLKGSVSATDYINLIAGRLNLEYTTVQQAFMEIKDTAAARRYQKNESAPEPVTPAAQMPSAATKIIEADKKTIEAEYELIALVVSQTRILDNIEDELRNVSWHDKNSEAMATALLGISHDANPSQAFAVAYDACPQASSLLAGAGGEYDDTADALRRANLLICTLREKELERRIRLANAKLRESDALTTQEADELFKETVSLQKELKDLRNNDLKEFAE